MKVLHKTLVRKWFLMIESGIKKEEYLEIKPYWISRLCGTVGLYLMSPEGITNLHEHNYNLLKFKHFDIISANNGYQKNCPNIQWEHKGTRIGTGREEWGAVPGKQYFILEIGEIVKRPAP